MTSAPETHLSPADGYRSSASPAPPGPRSGSGSMSPAPSTLAVDSNKKRHNLTPAEKQALAVQKLMANADREVRLPGPSKEKHLRAPREMMKNVSGSSAGAGSGEFHVYKHSRRREYERIKLMEDKAKKEEDARIFAERQAALVADSEAKTSKNRSRREKKKAAKRAAKGGEAGTGPGKRAADDDEQDGEDGEGKRRRLAGGAGDIVFKRPGEEADEAEEEEEEEEEEG